MGQTVNLLAYAFGGSNPSLPTFKKSVPVGGCKTSVRRRAQGARREEGGWTLIRYIFAEVAQLIEHQPSKLRVASLSLVIRPKIQKTGDVAVVRHASHRCSAKKTAVKRFFEF